jgi:hypothetical protein
MRDLKEKCLCARGRFALWARNYHYDFDKVLDTEVSFQIRPYYEGHNTEFQIRYRQPSLKERAKLRYMFSQKIKE